MSKKQQDENQDEIKKGTFADVIKKMAAEGKKKGFVTYDTFNKALPEESFSSEQIDDAMSALSDMGIQLVESEDDASGEETESKKKNDSDDDDESDYESGGNISDDDSGRTDDPVRMYLREMGAVELLSREGEIAIAKRIEAGRELMIGGMCESPLAIESIIAWYEALQNGDILLREVIDLDTTYNQGPDVEGVEAGESDGAESEEDQPKAKPAKATPAPKKEEKPKADDEGGEEGSEGEDEDSDPDEDDEAAVSLSAMEEELAPQVFEVFAGIQKTYKKMQKVQSERLDALQKGEEPKEATNKKYLALKDEMVAHMNEVHLNNARIEQLIERLYSLLK